jgi:nucleotide-binding universal stress UspA family protein
MFADLIVTARGAEHDITNRSVLEAALIETGRPLLIPAGNTPQSIIGGTVAIAWKASPQAARAVAAAMPFLVRATETVVMTVNAGDGDDDADRLVHNLAWHGVRAMVDRLHAEDQDPAEMLLSAAGRRAQLLVMGGYGHSRVREWILGGFTQRVLADAPLPVLLAH